MGKIALNACKTHSVNPCYFEKVKDSSYQELVQWIPRITFWISKMNDHPIILNHVYLQRTNNWNIVTDGKKNFFHISDPTYHLQWTISDIKNENEIDLTLSMHKRSKVNVLQATCYMWQPL